MKIMRYYHIKDKAVLDVIAESQAKQARAADEIKSILAPILPPDAQSFCIREYYFDTRLYGVKLKNQAKYRAVWTPQAGSGYFRVKVRAKEYPIWQEAMKVRYYDDDFYNAVGLVREPFFKARPGLHPCPDGTYIMDSSDPLPAGAITEITNIEAQELLK